MSEDTGWRTEPEIGMGATESVGSDSYAYTITDISNQTVTFMLKNQWDQERRVDPITGRNVYEYKTMEVTWPKAIWVVRDDAKAKSKEGGYQLGDKVDYDYTSDYRVENAKKYILHKDGFYREASTKLNPNTGNYEYGNTTKKTNRTIGIGFRRTYWDPSF